MKIRRDFVTNSSSSSFVISRVHLSPFQLLAIRDHAKSAEALGIDDWESADEWTIVEEDMEVRGWCSVNNFDIEELFRRLYIPDCYIKWRNS